MDFSNFLFLGQEIGLVAVFVILFLYDTFASDKGKRYFQAVACSLFALLTVYGFLPGQPVGEAFGGMYVSSSMTILMKNILNIGTLIVLLQTGNWLSAEGTVHKRGEFFTITLVTLLGMYFMISAGNYMMLYIGIEAASLPMACLAAFDKYKEKSAEAGVKYILISAFSSGVMLFGLSFIYGALGSFYFDNLSAAMVASPMVIVGFVFFFSGLGFKLSLVPFHLWTADVYEGSPTAVTAYLSVVSKAAAAFALIFSLYKVFGSMAEIWVHILFWIIIVTITLGNLFAIRQTDIKRFFAFSSISQAGYVLLGIVPGTDQGMAAMVYYLLVYVFSNMAVFGVIAAVEYQAKGDTRIEAFNGLYKSNPFLACVMTLGVFSLGGIPFFAGFFSKFFVFMSVIQQGEPMHYILVLIALLNTIISLYYYLLIVKAMWIKKGETQSVARFRVDNYNRVSLLICLVGILALGFFGAIYTSIDAISFGI